MSRRIGPRHLVYRIHVPSGILVGMSLPPRRFDWGTLGDAGISYLVSLCEVELERDTRPLVTIYQCEMEDIDGDEQPADLVRDRTHMWRAAYQVALKLRAGFGVAVHCNGGRDRTGSVLAAALQLQGTPVDQAIAKVDLALQKIGTPGWPASPWRVRQLYDAPTIEQLASSGDL